MEKQQSIDDILAEDKEYQKFVEKFKPKKTTDDCYTPDNIYEAVKKYCVDRYKIDPEKIVRPFWPGGSYEAFDYPNGCTVVDNPPFSIMAKIVAFYNFCGIKYFLFCPSLTSIRLAGCVIYVDCDITYENGAVVLTAFVTNMEPGIKARTAPELYKILKAENEKNLREQKKELPKYSYPDHVVMANDLQKLAHRGIDFSIREDECVRISAIDAQKMDGKACFGGALLVNDAKAAERAAAERAAATRYELSTRERMIVNYLNSRKGG